MSDITRLLHQLGAVLEHVSDELEDEGDRAYLGSTNDVALLRAASALYSNYRFDTDDQGSEEALAEVFEYAAKQRFELVNFICPNEEEGEDWADEPSPAVERTMEHLHLLDAQTSLARLTAKWPEYYWSFGRGKCIPNEPLYGIHLFVADDYTGDVDADVIAYKGEHDNPDECVRGAVAWAETQDRKAEKCL